MGKEMSTEHLTEISQNGPQQNQLVVGTYAVSRFGGGGGDMTLTAPPSNYSIWVISNSEFIVLDTDKAATSPAVWHFLKSAFDGWL